MLLIWYREDNKICDNVTYVANFLYLGVTIRHFLDQAAGGPPSTSQDGAGAQAVQGDVDNCPGSIAVLFAVPDEQALSSRDEWGWDLEFG